jgi:SAM-dependent methyltransferase
MSVMDYDEVYRSSRPPWQIGGPQPALAPVLEGEVRGPRVLDAGCGQGDLAIELARRGFEVTGFDISGVAIDQARAKAAAAGLSITIESKDAAGLSITFDVQDATRLSLPAASFDSIFDSGLLHSLHRIGPDQVDAYLARLPVVAAPGCALFIVAVSVEAGEGWGISEDFLRDAFGSPRWRDTTIEPVDVTAMPEGEAPLSLRAHLLRAVRA